MSYGIYIGKNHSRTGHAWLAGYGDESSSHWLEIIPEASHPAGATITVGVGPEADLPGMRTDIPQVAKTARHIRVSYSYYMGVPAPITNGGLNAHGVAVRDIWSPSRDELVEMTPKGQTGPNYSDFARIVMERARSAREAVEIVAGLIAQHGESSYGGNSHVFADTDEAWVMIQFAGDLGLWVAERLGPDSIRASRPGYIQEVPVHVDEHPDFLWSPGFISFAREMGWYTGGSFNANMVYGDGKGRWEGIRWIEGEMHKRAIRTEKIGFEDMIWAVRTPKLTGDTAGYGQVVPLVNPADPALRMLWHAPVGALAAPFAPVFMRQKRVPAEFAKHRYLTHGESHRFMDKRKAISEGSDTVSTVPQANEVARSAVFECKRLMYVMQLLGAASFERVAGLFVAREAELAGKVERMLGMAEVLIGSNRNDDAGFLLDYLSETELRAGLDMVIALTAGLEAELRASGRSEAKSEPVTFKQVW